MKSYKYRSESSTGEEVGQGADGTGSGAGMVSLSAPFSSSGVIRSMGSMTVFFKMSKASCARPVTPVANDFIGRYVTRRPPLLDSHTGRISTARKYFHTTPTLERDHVEGVDVQAYSRRRDPARTSSRAARTHRATREGENS